MSGVCSNPNQAQSFDLIDLLRGSTGAESAYTKPSTYWKDNAYKPGNFGDTEFHL